MHAPIDIVISLLRRKHQEALKERDTYSTLSPTWYCWDGKAEAYQEFIEELEGIKKIFN